MIYGAPELAELAVHLHKDLVQMPAPLRIAAHARDSSFADLGGEHRAKPVPPGADGLVADVDPTLRQEILDIAQRQRVSHVLYQDQADDLWRAVIKSAYHEPAIASLFALTLATRQSRRASDCRSATSRPAARRQSNRAKKRLANLDYQHDHAFSTGRHFERGPLSS